MKNIPVKYVLGVVLIFAAGFLADDSFYVPVKRAVAEVGAPAGFALAVTAGMVLLALVGGVVLIRQAHGKDNAA
jgi:hypothetical protein